MAHCSWQRQQKKKVGSTLPLPVCYELSTISYELPLCFQFLSHLFFDGRYLLREPTLFAFPYVKLDR